MSDHLFRHSGVSEVGRCRCVRCRCVRCRCCDRYRHPFRKGQRVHSFLQDPLDGGVGRVSEVQGSSTGGFQSLCREALCQSEKPSGNRHSIDHRIVEKLLHDFLCRSSDSLCVLLALLPAARQSRDLFGGQVVDMGLALSRFRGPIMAGDVLVLLVVDLHRG